MPRPNTPYDKYLRRYEYPDPYARRPNDPSQLIAHGGFTATRGQRQAYAATGAKVPFADWRTQQRGELAIDWSGIPSGAAGAVEMRRRMDTERQKRQLAEFDPAGTDAFGRALGLAKQAQARGDADQAKVFHGLSQSIAMMRLKGSMAEKGATATQKRHEDRMELARATAKRATAAGERATAAGERAAAAAERTATATERGVAREGLSAAQEVRISRVEARIRRQTAETVTPVEKKIGRFRTQIASLETKLREYQVAPKDDPAMDAKQKMIAQIRTQLRVKRSRVADFEAELKVAQKGLGTLHEEADAIRGRNLSKEIADQILGETGDDAEKARELARKRGYRF